MDHPQFTNITEGQTIIPNYPVKGLCNPTYTVTLWEGNVGPINTGTCINGTFSIPATFNTYGSKIITVAQFDNLSETGADYRTITVKEVTGMNLNNGVLSTTPFVSTFTNNILIILLAALSIAALVLVPKYILNVLKSNSKH